MVSSSAARARRAVPAAVALAAVQVVVTAAFVVVPGSGNDIRLLYVCATPVAAHRLRPAAAVMHAALVGVLLAIALCAHGGDAWSLVRIWATTMGVVVVVMALVGVTAASVRREVRQMDHAATHDPLTGLANRTLLALEADRALARLGAASAGQVFMILIDLDRFKLLNDTYGHHAGDQLLVALAARLRGCAPAGSVIARLGGDEFAILVEDPHGMLSPMAVAEAVTAAWDQPIALDRGAVRTSGCLGVAVAAPSHTTSMLLRHADAAMYRAKAMGRSGIRLYDDAQQIGMDRSLDLEQALFDAIGNGELSIVFQPIVDLRDGWVRAAEALARWTHPVFGVVQPDEFIPIAETSGMIDAIGLWVMDEALRQVSQWRASGVVHSDFRVHVNVSGKQLHGPLADQISRLLELHAMEPTALMMELTESVLMRADDEATEVLWALEELGVPIALDDFGTGFSSLSYLLQANFHAVKIDRAFVSGMTVDRTRCAIVRTVIGLADALGLQVIAEGVDVGEQIDLLIEMGCHLGQGYLLSEPLKASGMVDFLDSAGHSVR